MPKFNATKSAENKLGVQLRKVGKIVGGIIETYEINGIIENPQAMQEALDRYAVALGPWAENVTAKILKSVDANNARDWKSTADKLSVGLKNALDNTPTGLVMRSLQLEQVELIKSLPIEAGLKAQEITRKAITTGERAASSAKKIFNLGDITENRATLIARTETAKANATLNQARADSVGVPGYIWRTMRNADVRPSHAVMEGTIQRFDTPPAIEGEGNHGPGMFPNCNCYAEPIITMI